MSSKVKSAISFRELKDELLHIVAGMDNDDEGEEYIQDIERLIHRIDTEAITYGSGKSTPGADDAHKMPWKQYWRYEFAKAVLTVCAQDQGTDSAARDAMSYADAMLEALQEGAE